VTMSFKNKESAIQVTICCPPASFTSGRKNASRSVVRTLSITKSMLTLSYGSQLLRGHENRTGKGFCAHIRTVILAQFLYRGEAASRRY